VFALKRGSRRQGVHPEGAGVDGRSAAKADLSQLTTFKAGLQQSMKKVRECVATLKEEESTVGGHPRRGGVRSQRQIFCQCWLISHHTY
jgi:hypothetical protein